MTKNRSGVILSLQGRLMVSPSFLAGLWVFAQSEGLIGLLATLNRAVLRQTQPKWMPRQPSALCTA